MAGEDEIRAARRQCRGASERVILIAAGPALLLRGWAVFASLQMPERSAMLLENVAALVLVTIAATVALMGMRRQRMAERKLRQAMANVALSEQRFRSAFNHCPVGIALVAPDGRWLSVNRELCDLFGYTEEEMLATTAVALTHRDDLEASRQRFERFQHAPPGPHDTYRIEKRYIHKSGRVIWTSVNASLMRDAAGRPLHSVSHIMDITHRRSAERKLRQLNRELFESLRTQEKMTSELALAKESAEEASEIAMQANAAKSRFLANMSHEIRTPMTAILGFAERLLDTRLADSDRADCAQTIYRNGQHLLELISDVLDLSKIEAGRMECERIECRPGRIIADVATMMRPRANAAGLKFDVVCKTPIPETIQTDPTRFRQILTNLLSNAIKFTPAGSVKMELSLESKSELPASEREHEGKRPARSLLRVSVIDTGIGLTREQMNRLFKPFSQADCSTTRRFGGTGLGLVICRRMTDMLGGEIAVSSEPGRGSIFSFTIDPGDVSNTRLTDNSGANDMATFSIAPQPQHVLAGARILVADDGADNRRLICLHLRDAGAEVIAVANGLEALHLFDDAQTGGQPFHLVLTDIEMPEMDGYALTAALRARSTVLPIIALTAHALTTDRQRCLSAGCTGYLAKPIDRAALLDLLCESLRKSKGDAKSDEIHATMAQLIREYVAELPPIVAELRQNLTEGNHTQLRALIHRLKGSGGGYGFASISESADRAEHAIDRGESADAIARRINELIDAIHRVDGYQPQREHIAA